MLIFGYEEESELFVEIFSDHPPGRPPLGKGKAGDEGTVSELGRKYASPLGLASEGVRP